MVGECVSCHCEERRPPKAGSDVAIPLFLTSLVEDGGLLRRPEHSGLLVMTRLIIKKTRYMTPVYFFDIFLLSNVLGVFLVYKVLDVGFEVLYVKSLSVGANLLAVPTIVFKI